MQITLHRDFDSLAAHLAQWNELSAGVPFRRWDWLEAWWRHYGCDKTGRPHNNYELFLLAVWDESQALVGIAPWYRFRSRSGARAIHFLGDGEVCSDYLSILCKPQHADGVATGLADWLSEANSSTAGQASRSSGDDGSNAGSEDRGWDRLEIFGVDAADHAVNQLVTQLQARGSIVSPCRPMNTWRLPLPASWEELLKGQSKQHRNRLRKADREYFQSGRITARRVNTPEEFDRFFEILIDLHGRRWQHKGLPGAFASSRFRGFHREIAARWWAEDLATLTWFEFDEKPLAVEYRLHGDGVMYAYQSGMDTSRLELRPGEMANMAAIRHAIEHGQQAYDFLRGDEEYKSRWRAQPRPMLMVRVVPPHPTARLRHSVWLAGQTVKRWLKQSAKLAGRRTTSVSPQRQKQLAGDEQ
jgi:CelD/BcsL family acetyltransferase involved in cellulose biosynthesis